MATEQFKRDYDGRFICPHNEECRCTSTNCEPCGWNPKVYKQRIKAIAQRLGVPANELAKVLPAEEVK